MTSAEKEALRQNNMQIYPRAMFMLEPNTYKAVRFYDAGTYTITVTGSKAETMDTYSKNFYVSEVVSNNW